MPHTVNGIGTHYYGKKNLQTRPGVCDFCRRETTLSSYDTRLWFVVFFIPIIPLGRKRILNYCPKCTRHRVISLAEWEKVKSQNLGEAMAGLTANPNDPQAAIKAHRALVGFGQTAEAEKLMVLMKDRFANNADMQAYLGSMLNYLGKYEQSIPYYERALSLNPDLAEAKVAIALNFINKNKLDEAHKLLQFLEAPGVAEYSGALLALAEGYQRAGRHAEALKLFNLLLERYPRLANDKKFRKAYKKSEGATGAPSSLPPRKINWGPGVAVGGVIALIAVIALISNYYISQHQTLYLVSGLAQPVTVSIPGHGETVISSRGLWTMTLPEGHYQAALTGATNETVDFTIASTFWGRWFGKPLFVLNAGSSALLWLQNATYSANANDRRASFSFHFGKPFVTFPEIDYPFVPFPERVSVDSYANSAQKTHVEVFPGDPGQAFLFLAGKRRYGEALDLAEWNLRLHPEATQTLPFYFHYAEAAGQSQRALDFLAEAIKRRPVELEWHRAYQESRIAVNHDAAKVLGEYDTLLQADPTNSALLYLDGRLQMSKKNAMPLYRQAISQNPGNYFAHFALGQSFMDQGEWSNALPELSEALRLDPGNMMFEQAENEARMALKDYSGLEKDLQARLRAKPLDFRATACLGNVLIIEGHVDEMQKLIASCESKLRADDPGDDGEYIMNLRSEMLYSAGKFDDLEKLTAGRRGRGGGTAYRFEVLVELGRLQEATDALNARDPKEVDPYEWVALSTAWKQSGNEQQASATRAQAIKSLAAERPESAIAAQWLANGSASLDDVMNLATAHDRKRVLLVALAQQAPGDRAAFLAAARRLNVSRSFPFHLINRLTDSAAMAGQ